jgi:diaminobutyrate-2-oxoglutarate transaminase
MTTTDLSAQEILARQEHRESAARSHARALPIVPRRAYGMTIESLDGRKYLDCISGGGAFALGHNHPAVVEAAATTSAASARCPRILPVACGGSYRRWTVTHRPDVFGQTR